MPLDSAFRHHRSGTTPTEPTPTIDGATRVLSRRLRFALFAAIGPLLLFSLFDLVLVRDRLAEFWAIKVAALAILAAALVALGPPRGRTFVVTVGLIAVALLYGLSSLSAILAREPLTTPLISITVAIGTATLLPWGLLPQLAVVAIALVSTVAAAYAATGTFWSLVAYPNVGVAIGLAMSVYIAYELEQSRRALARHDRERQHAEGALQKLNTVLEQRVTERTVELAGVNAQLAAEVAQHREARAELSALIESTDNAIWSVDRSYRVIAFNSLMQERYSRMFGEPLSIGVSLEERVPEQWPGWKRIYDRTFAGERFTIEHEVDMPEGKRFFATSMNPIVDTGAVRGATVFSIDVTERRRSEEEARLHEAELAHVLRLATMGEMAAGLAHEINQPLAAIVNFARGCSRRLADGARDLGEVIGAIDAIAVEALRAGEIIRRIRRMVRKETPREELVAVPETVADVVQLLQPETNELGIEVEVRCDEDLRRVAGDRIQIEQILLNLMRNAIDAMAEKDGPRRLAISARPSGQASIEVIVEDDGPGLPAAIAERVFDPFYTTKRTGLGMGLSISRTIAEAHGGRLVAVPSERGARFCLTLPVAPGDRQPGIEARGQQDRDVTALDGDRPPAI